MRITCFSARWYIRAHSTMLDSVKVIFPDAKVEGDESEPYVLLGGHWAAAQTDADLQEYLAGRLTNLLNELDDTQLALLATRCSLGQGMPPPNDALRHGVLAMPTGNDQHAGLGLVA